jgi:lysozyme family protein
MKANFTRALAATLKHEGGWSDHPADPGGATQKGITLATFRRYVPNASKTDLRNITDTQIEQIYRDGYWNKIKGDDLPFGVDFAVFDFAVNSGPARAAIYLQEIVGVAPDGKIGPLTLAAVDKWDAVKLIEKLCANRMAFLKRLSTWATFGKGWSRRVTEVLRMAKDMAIALPKPAPAKPEPVSRPTVWSLLIDLFKAIFKRG